MRLLAIRDLNSQDPLPGLGPKHQPASAPAPTPAAREVRPGIIQAPDGKLSTNIPHAPPQPPTPPAALEAASRNVHDAVYLVGSRPHAIIVDDVQQNFVVGQQYKWQGETVRLQWKSKSTDRCVILCREGTSSVGLRNVSLSELS